VFLSWNLIFWTEIGLSEPTVVTSNLSNWMLAVPGVFQVKSG